MKKRVLYSALLVALALNLFVGANLYIANAKSASGDDVYSQIELFSRVLERVRKDYVDGDKLTYQDLVYSALKGMLGNLDPHSEFMEPEKFEDLKADTEGAFGGVGITIGIKDSYLTVVAPMEDTPAFRAGIMSGDRIIKIEGKPAGKVTLTDAVKKLRGAPGTEVNLTMFRPSSNTTRDVSLKRELIKVSTVKDLRGKSEFTLLDNKIGYARITQFNEPTGSELEDALKKMETQGVKALVIDLRGNPGGLLDQAVRVCEKFLPRNQLVVSTEGRTAGSKTEYRATGRDQHPNLPIALIVNGGSASASEIVAGCLQDLKRAILVGEQTFGKGSVQSILPLQAGNGPALRLTTAKYYTPSHKVIHEKGITPDIIVPISADEEEALFLQRTPGGLENLDEEKRKRVEATRDVQLDRATDLLKGIIMFAEKPKLPGKVASR